MSLLTGMTEAGQEVPVQVKPDGRLVAEGLMGPVGPVGPVGDAQFTVLGDSVYLPSPKRLGLGTSTVSSLFHVYSASTNEPSLTYNAAALKNSWSSAVQLAEGVSASAPYPYWMQVRDSGNAARPLVLNPLGGSVGIGTTSPSELLTVSGKVSAHSLKLRSPDGSWWDLAVSDAGALTVTRAALLKK
jgi:hypothetical protein